LTLAEFRPIFPDPDLPEIARLGSITIRVYADDAWRHHRPHFHAVDPNSEVVVSLPELTILAGRLWRSAEVIAWAADPVNLRRLIDAWNAGNPNRPVTGPVP
jgi:hypothetical protein